MPKPLEAYLRSMSQHSLPITFISMSFSDMLTKYSSLSNGNVDLMTQTTSSSLVHVPNPQHACTQRLTYTQTENGSSMMKDDSVIQLSVKNVCTIHALVNISHGLGGVLDGAWTVVLETFEKLDFIFHKLPWRLVNDKQEPISADSHWNDEVKMLDARLQQLFESSVYLDDQALNALLVALGHLSSSSLAGLATTMNDSGPVSPPTQVQSSQSTESTSLHNTLEMKETLEKVKSFALRKFVETMEVNIYRLDTFWTDAYGHLHLVINNKYHPQLRKFGMSCLLQIQLKALTSVYGAHRDNANDESADEIAKQAQNMAISNNANLQATKKEIKQQTVVLIMNSLEKIEFQKTLLSPYTKLFASKYDDTREQVIKSVSELLEQCGQYITVGWPTIVELLHCVVFIPFQKKKKKGRGTFFKTCMLVTG
ncbi:hypothetical protein RFI_12937 [Reticulomyxa filosa]|uniref:Mon2/Sec7/BIG1-like HDS domain-containing protein n=1 Tax=Reticulomyxa filosa TaxID=46433 RepID=X6NE05_RETFI|nr:hypothetical protein RFI_12937 [Reticulomyxa filosa]|eukprot:ETO24216.1 hypothetical protein RFI_12937 [Reticulomyxa filosa]